MRDCRPKRASTDIIFSGSLRRKQWCVHDHHVSRGTVDSRKHQPTCQARATHHKTVRSGGSEAGDSQSCASRCSFCRDLMGRCGQRHLPADRRAKHFEVNSKVHDSRRTAAPATDTNGNANGHGRGNVRHNDVYMLHRDVVAGAMRLRCRAFAHYRVPLAAVHCLDCTIHKKHTTIMTC